MITQGSLTWLLERIHRAGFQERRILMSCWIFFSFFSFFSFLFFISFLPSLLSLIMADSIRRVPPLHNVHILDAVLFPFPFLSTFPFPFHFRCPFVPLFLSSSSLRLRLLLILECKSSFLFSFLFFFFSFCQSVERLKVKGNLRFSSLSSSNLLLLQHLLQHLILSFSFLSF